MIPAFVAWDIRISTTLTSQPPAIALATGVQVQGAEGIMPPVLTL
jgi:hypothetical protein